MHVNVTVVYTKDIMWRIMGIATNIHHILATEFFPSPNAHVVMEKYGIDARIG